MLTDPTVHESITMHTPEGQTWQVRSQYLRIGKQLLTEDGWQTIYGLVVFKDADQVSVFTDERDDEGTDGWCFTFDQVVTSRHEPTEEIRLLNLRADLMERRRQRRMAMAAANCPEWCIEHYTGVEKDTCHSSEPLSVDAADVYTGKAIELGLWMERRDHPGDSPVTVGVLEVRTITEDIELTPANMRLLAAKLMSLADRADLHR